MHPFRQRRECQGDILRAVLAGLCILLVLLVGAAQVLHSHAADAPDANCSLCLVAHLAASPAEVLAGFWVAGLVRAAAPPEAVSVFFSSAVFSFFIRPPPALNPA